jgi:hypothetical protein
MGYFTTASTRKKAQTRRESLRDSRDVEQTQGSEPEEPELPEEPEEPEGPDDTGELTSPPPPLPKAKRGRKPKVIVVDDAAEEQLAIQVNEVSFCIIVLHRK